MHMGSRKEGEGSETGTRFVLDCVLSRLEERQTFEPLACFSKTPGI
jgi:hypothetical protein